MELLFELGCEELPARFVDPTLGQIRDGFLKACEDLRIDVGEVRTLSTPRRLTLLVEGLADAQADLEEERTGPPVRAAYKDGEPTKAAEGFARGQGVAVEDLYTVETDKGEYIAAKVFEKGGPTHELLPGILEGIVRGLNFPKSMRWADYKETFGRPVRWMVAVAGGETIRFEFAGVTSGNTSYGHRFAAPGAIEVGSIADYESKLAEFLVIADPAKRRATIEAGLAEVGQQAGGKVIDDPALLDEVVNLIEKAHVIRVEFSQDYLEVPDEVLISSMRSHQRYFAIADANGALVNSCAVVYNTPVHDPKVVAAGNLRVLKARLDDARFFWEQDLRVPLEEFVSRLGDVVWLKQIGTMKERSARISMTAAHIAEAIEAGEDTVEHARRAGYLCKADLMTQMVYEFPDLQGVMGREYAKKAGEADAVAKAIDEQYLPKGADGNTPQTDAGACVALAEKLDALVGCFGVGLVPTSAADPYALRRAALGCIRILQDRGYSVSLPTLVQLALDTYDELDAGKLKDAGELKAEVLEFMGTRLKHQLAADHPADVVDAVIAVGLDDVLSITDRVEALGKLTSEDDFLPLAQGFKRVVNILRKQAADADSEQAVNTGLLQEAGEVALHEAAQKAGVAVNSAVEARDWDAACRTLIGLKAPVDTFFDDVMVMVDDEALKANRIALLFQLEKLFMNVADISQISAR